MRRRLENTLSQSHVGTTKMLLKEVRDTFKAILWIEIGRTKAEIDNRKNKQGINNVFEPLFDFSKQSNVIFDVEPDKNRQPFDINVYYSNVACIGLVEFRFLNMVASQDDFIAMLNELLMIMNPTQDQIQDVNIIKRVLEELSQPQKPAQPQGKMVSRKPWMNKPFHIFGDFDLTRLHALVSDELERVKCNYLRYIKNEKSRGEKTKAETWENKMREAHKLGGILQVYPEQGDEKLTQDFLLAVRYFLENFPDASSSILVDSLRPGLGEYVGLSSECKKTRCLANFKKLATNGYWRIASMLQQETEQTSSVRMFQPRPPENGSRPPLARSSTGKPSDFDPTLMSP